MSRTKQQTILQAAFLCTLAALIVFAWLGVDFSPSFTSMFVFTFLVVAVMDEVCAEWGRFLDQEVPHLLRQVSYFAGLILVPPAVCIYAAGDDWLTGCVWFALVGYALLCIASHVRRRGAGNNGSSSTSGSTSDSTGSGTSGGGTSGGGTSGGTSGSGTAAANRGLAAEHVLFGSALFTLACAVPSTALWPLGLGLLALYAARSLRRFHGHTAVCPLLAFMGIALGAVFLAAPMLF